MSDEMGASGGPAAASAGRLAARPALPPMDHAERRERLRRSVVGRSAAPDEVGAGADHGATEGGGGSGGGVDVGWMLVSGTSNVRYLSGFHGTNGQVLIGPTAAEDRLVTDARYEARAATESAGLQVALSRDPVGVALEVADAGLAVEAAHVTWDEARGLMQRARDADVPIVGTTGAVECLRESKDDAEVARLERACEVTAAALRWLFDEVVAPGRTERELALALERRFVDLGADAAGFPSIVASGPNAAVPHHEPTDRALRVGDVLTVDCGAVVDGYHADLTRTVALGHLDDELVAVHDLVRSAQAAGRRAVTVGRAARDVDAAARAIITDAGFGERFVHGTGHGVGLEIHEAPAVATTSTATLRAGTALTVEPGVYLPGLGGVRIEDTIVVTADGDHRILTDIPHELRIL